MVRRKRVVDASASWKDIWFTSERHLRYSFGRQPRKKNVDACYGRGAPHIF